MRRWTDGKSWSASRVSGSFLTYREMEGKRGGNGFTPPAQAAKRPSGKTPDGSNNGDSDEGPDGYRYKPDGLMKQSFSITTSSGQHLHLISYYARSHNAAAPLQQPTQDPNLRHIRPPKNMYPESTVNETTNVPAVTRGPMPGSPYAPANMQMGMGSPYNRPVNGQPTYMPAGNWPPTPNGTPPVQYAFYPPQGHPHHQSPIQFQQVLYAHPYPHNPPGPTVFDRPPPPMSTTLPPPPPSHMAGMMGYHPPPHYIPHPSPRAVGPPPDSVQHQHHPHQHQQHQNPHHAQATSHPNANQHIRDQGVQLPAINGSASGPGRQDKLPSPQPAEQRPQNPESLTVPETSTPPANNTASPARTFPSLGSLLNSNPADNGVDGKSNHSNSRSGSKSPNSGQRSTCEIPGDRLNGNSADNQALRKLNEVMAIPLTSR